MKGTYYSGKFLKHRVSCHLCARLYAGCGEWERDGGGGGERKARGEKERKRGPQRWREEEGGGGGGERKGSGRERERISRKSNNAARCTSRGFEFYGY